MSVLFKPYKIRNLETRNRFMRSATTSAHSDERGIVRPEIIKLYEELAKGGIGLIVKGHLYVTEKGKAHQGMAGISNDNHIPKLRELTDTVHRHGGVIMAQINHGGYQATAGERAGPSDYQGDGWRARAMDPSEIWATIEAFGSAARRAVDAGFDGVQIHAAHGYLVSQFLSKHANLRTDEWGGSLKNRTRFLEKVYDEIRGRLGSDYPIMMKINCDDFSPDGFTVEEAAEVSHAMAVRGIDLIEVSGGGIGRKEELRIRAKHKDLDLFEPNFAGHCERIRASTKPKPLALVNGFRTLTAMQAIIDRGIADLISLSRPFIREPKLVKSLQEGQSEVTCTRCDICRAPEFFGKVMLRCHLE